LLIVGYVFEHAGRQEGFSASMATKLRGIAKQAEEGVEREGKETLIELMRQPEAGPMN
jgi:hypothetical protein